MITKTQIEEAKGEHPQFWETVRDAIANAETPYSSVAHLLSRNIRDYRIPDNRPLSFLSVVVPAFTPPTLYPRVLPETIGQDTVDQSEKLTGVLRWSLRKAKLDRLFPLLLTDAACYGIAHLYIAASDKGVPTLEYIPHDRVVFEAGCNRVEAGWCAIQREVNRAEAKNLGISVKRLTSVTASDTAEQNTMATNSATNTDRYQFWEVWDKDEKQWYWLGDDGKVLPKKKGDWPDSYTDWPLVTLEFGDMPTARYPLGLVAPWLTTLAHLRTVKTWLMINANLQGLSPTIIAKSAFSDKMRDQFIEILGMVFIVASDGFFDAARGKVRVLSPTPYTKEFYEYIALMEQQLQTDSHYSDLMQARQMRQGISKEEIKAIQQSQSLWVGENAGRVKRVLEELGHRVLEALASAAPVKVFSSSGRGNKQVKVVESDITAGIECELPPFDMDSYSGVMDRLGMLLGIVEQHVDAFGPRLDPDEVVKRVLRALDLSTLYTEPQEAPVQGGQQVAPPVDPAAGLLGGQPGAPLEPTGDPAITELVDGVAQILSQIPGISDPVGIATMIVTEYPEQAAEILENPAAAPDIVAQIVGAVQ